jgi:predicted RNA-binding Zn ribbon-like protein
MKTHALITKSRVPPSEVDEELCIRFVNTVAWRLRDLVEDRVKTTTALLEWFAAAGVADASFAVRLRARWEKHPRERELFRESAVRLREAIYQILLSQIGGKAFDRSALKILNAATGAHVRGLGIAPSKGRLVWRSDKLDSAADDLLKPIAWSAVGLLMGPRSGKVRQCQDERGCGWLFVDESRAQNRRWCSMGDCGNRAKVLRHYHRHGGRELASSR